MTFSHEKPIVYQKRLEFNQSAHELLQTKAIKGDSKDQLSRAAHGITLNIAEGNGKFSGKNGANFFQPSQRSAMECAAPFDLMKAEGKIPEEEPAKEKITLEETAGTRVRLMGNPGTNSLHEESVDCGDRE